jgi:N-formylglutamate amidohydrolase
VRGIRATNDDAPYERITADDLDLAPDELIPLRFVPARRWSPVVISFPHVGLAWPARLRPKPQVDLRRNADYEVHRLYATASDAGAACVQAVYSRLVVDLNRADDDISARLVPDHPAPRPRRSPGSPEDALPVDAPVGRPGRGVVWAAAVGNIRILSQPLAYREFEERIRRYHAPYYRALRLLLERRVARFGFAVLVDAHSMPGTVGPDLVVGTLDGRSCDDLVARRALTALRGSFDVRRDEPYRGGELVRTFGRPDAGLHAFQLEVSRGLYMDEASQEVWFRPPDATPGTSDRLDRDTRIRAGGRSLRGPTPRQARGLAELASRVRSMIERLCALGDDAAATAGLAERSVAPEARVASLRETDPGLSNETYKG